MTSAQARWLSGPIFILETDVGNETDVTRLGDTAIAKFGRIDERINNAGVEMDHPVDYGVARLQLRVCQAISTLGQCRTSRANAHN